MDSDKLKGKMAEKKYTQREMALRLGIIQKSLNSKINQKTQFILKEVCQIIEILELENELDIFFDNKTSIMQQKTCIHHDEINKNI